MIRIHLLSVAGAVLLLAGCESPASPSADSDPLTLIRSSNAIANSVTGGARLDLSAWNLPPETYTINVRKDGNGRVSGKVSIKLSDPEASFDMEPYCLQVDGNLAWVEGLVTKTNSAEFPLGTPIFFRVRDNGQGANAQPDGISFIFFGNAIVGRCALRFGLGAPWQLSDGNIQVR